MTTIPSDKPNCTQRNNVTCRKSSHLFLLFLNHYQTHFCAFYSIFYLFFLCKYRERFSAEAIMVFRRNRYAIGTCVSHQSFQLLFQFHTFFVTIWVFKPASHEKSVSKQLYLESHITVDIDERVALYPRNYKIEYIKI